jgi:hypothetical protein
MYARRSTYSGARPHGHQIGDALTSFGVHASSTSAYLVIFDATDEQVSYHDGACMAYRDDNARLLL